MTNKTKSPLLELYGSGYILVQHFPLSLRPKNPSNKFMTHEAPYMYVYREAWEVMTSVVSSKAQNKRGKRLVRAG